MFSALARSLDQLGDPAIRRVLLISILAALIGLVLLVVAAGWGLGALQLFDIGWLDTALEWIGTISAVVLAFLVFPGMASVISTFFLEDIARAVERRHYPGLPPARPQKLVEALVSALRFFGILVVFNLAAFVVTIWIPGLNLVVFLLLNGYLVGREYFEIIAFRRLDPVNARALRRRYRGRVIAAGILIAALMGIPVVNLVLPVLATMFMVHIFQQIATREHVT